ncbi:diguanylate cyclase (GGDEF)-like protein [Angulomicrobium tetraedrale]|uniref:diguanylate cyclase n=1 Tax=Ancylobacter tetraedralis TaxID=217068 RepID=A0A839ZE16_9HYPH|nr:GGDEF domain-containing protein [Ancylobacter tetraedralis]MBB3772872.1 diguanylate cyclase (GGDEF)-like protein [Ancylobacter tetraedralis]
MGLDPWTLWTVVTLVSGLVIGALLLAWAAGPAERSLAYWAAGLACMVFAILCGFAMEHLPARLAIFLGNGAVLAGYGLFWASTRSFRGRAVRWRLVAAAPALWGALCLLPFFEETLVERLLIQSVLAAGLLGLAMREVWRSEDPRGIGQRGLLAVLAFMLLMQFVRIAVVTLFVGARPVMLMTPVGVAFGVAALTSFFLASFLLTLAVRERREAHFANAARRDELTGLSNRRDFHERAADICRRGGDIAMVLLDLDHFKQVNDSHGHAAGDRVLTAFAAVLKDESPPASIIGRLGGEEFGAVLPAAQCDAARELAERWRRAFAFASAALGLGGAHAPLEPTVSIGIAFGRFPPAASAVEAEARLRLAIAQADLALYAAKAAGRNRVEVVELTPSSDSH